MEFQQFIDAISNDTSRIMQDNQRAIIKKIVENLPDEAALSADQLEAINNAVIISVQMSVQIIFDYLDSLGMLNLSNFSEHFEPPVLTLIKGGVDSPKK